MTIRELQEVEQFALHRVESRKDADLVLQVCKEVRRLRDRFREETTAEEAAASTVLQLARERESLLKRAVKEDGCMVSVGGLVTDLANPPAKPCPPFSRPDCFFRECPTPEKCQERCESGL